MRILKILETHKSNLFRYLLTMIIAGAISAFLIYFHFFFFKMAVDLFIIVTCFNIFIISVNSYPYSKNNYFLFLGISYQYVSLFFLNNSLFDFMMNSLGREFTYIPLKSFFIARIWEAVGLIIAPFLLKRKVNKNFWMILEGLLVVTIFIFMFNVKLVQDILIINLGERTFRVYNEMLIIGFLAVALAVIVLRRKDFQPRTIAYILSAILLKIAAGFVFTLSGENVFAAQIAFQFLLFFSFVVLYQVFVNVNLKKPYESIFSELHHVNEKIKMKSVDIENTNIRLQKEVDDRKMVEKILLQTKAQLKAILDNIPYLAWLKDRDSRFIEVNKPFADSTGKRPEELVGKTDFDIWPKKLAQKYREDDSQVMKQRTSKLMEEPIAERTGTRWFETYKTPIFNKDGDVIGTTGMARDITESRQASDRIKHSLKEKEVLLKEVHHRVKNNLQVISSLLNLQSAYFKDKQVKEFFLETQNRIHSMALVHEKFYQTEDLAHIDYRSYIQNLINHLSSSYSTGKTIVHFDIAIEDIVLNIDTAIQTGLIINELVSNSLKYAFNRRKEGKIRISFRADEDYFILQVSDNGIGLPKGLASDKLNTLGLQLVEALVSQLEGKMDVKSEKGAFYTLTFPIKKDEKKRLKTK